MKAAFLGVLIVAYLSACAAEDDPSVSLPGVIDLSTPPRSKFVYPGRSIEVPLHYIDLRVALVCRSFKRLQNTDLVYVRFIQPRITSTRL